jgi:hypothetical protein
MRRKQLKTCKIFQLKTLGQMLEVAAWEAEEAVALQRDGPTESVISSIFVRTFLTICINEISNQEPKEAVAEAAGLKVEAEEAPEVEVAGRKVEAEEAPEVPVLEVAGRKVEAAAVEAAEADGHKAAAAVAEAGVASAVVEADGHKVVAAVEAEAGAAGHKEEAEVVLKDGHQQEVRAVAK